ncbi:hypothetical protein PsYK624_151440 [Phanerochaete sordida]|uniref:Deoxyribonuclease NucA/NucB domain-containing protein n=1 Tax=Phanerochaete sordida TaxID=48140 RepID=A0A9P3LM22_9APHY|nr:hypothetical protein PsYK624_151440 [Phanerochaete sordida]
MHGFTSFTASFALLALLISSAAASPAGSAAVVRDDGADIGTDALEYTAPAHVVPTPTVDLDTLEDSASNVTTHALAPLAFNPYTIDCAATAYPNVCENWCYYAFCRKGATNSSDPVWNVTVNRNAGLRPYSECGRLNPNKCSQRIGVWPANPLASQDCDEQPKNTNDEGGANAATRCMPASENRGEGSRWAQYIRNDGPGMIANGRVIRVELQNPTGPLCASYRAQGTTVCPAPASPNDINVGIDAVRQQ